MLISSVLRQMFNLFDPTSSTTQLTLPSRAQTMLGTLDQPWARILIPYQNVTSSKTSLHRSTCPLQVEHYNSPLTYWSKRGGVLRAAHEYGPAEAAHPLYLRLCLNEPLPDGSCTKRDPGARTPSPGILDGWKPPKVNVPPAETKVSQRDPNQKLKPRHS